MVNWLAHKAGYKNGVLQKVDQMWMQSGFLTKVLLDACEAMSRYRDGSMGRVFAGRDMSVYYVMCYD